MFTNERYVERYAVRYFKGRRLLCDLLTEYYDFSL